MIKNGKQTVLRQPNTFYANVHISTQSEKTMKSHVINIDEIFKQTKDIKATIDIIIKFFEKSKIFIRTPKINKRDLSPNSIIK